MPRTSEPLGSSCLTDEILAARLGNRLSLEEGSHLQRHTAGCTSCKELLRCPDEEVLATLVDGRLSQEELARVHRHTAQCPRCHALLVALARGLPGLEDTPSTAPAEPPASGWTPPEEFDEFRRERLLGHGAMGVVYLAHDHSLDRKVAVKFIAAHLSTEQAAERFLTEARAIARLRQHPNVVTVFRVGQVDGHPYIVSEYLTGQGLDELELPLPWRRVLGLGLGLARGLAAAHRLGVLHRDLKPPNVFLTDDGRVKLLDFGLAEFIELNAAGLVRGTRSAAGTPLYMAPELFHKQPASPRSDIYSLGRVLLELCVGTPRGADIRDVPGIDPEFAALIERCIRDDPRERFASADELAGALERLGQPLDLEVRIEGNPYRGLAPFEAEHRALFFGRDADISAVLERLRNQPLLLVAGDSGVGKSSLCRAGILPRVAQGALDEWRDFTPLLLEPGRRPLAALASILSPILEQPEAGLGARLAQAPEAVAQLLRAGRRKGRGLLFFVDQLEELITLSEAAQASLFARFLTELALPAPGVRVLLTVRGDFLTRAGALLGLGAEAGRALYLLQPLSPDGVREAIVQPARGRGVAFESEQLLQTLVEATARGAGSLPLLQFALAELWERRDRAGGRITQAALDGMGGVEGALSRHADGVLNRLGEAERQAARLIFGRLITLDDTRGERSEEELTQGSAASGAALRALVEGRLVHARASSGRAGYELAHEALISHWGTLRGWLDEDAGHRALRQRLEAACAEWERLERAEDALWRERQLGEVKALMDTPLEPREQVFLHASQRAVRRRGLRRWLAVLTVLLAVGGALGGMRLQTQRFVRARLDEALAALSKGRAFGQGALARRDQALALFNGQPPTEGAAPKSVMGQRLLAEKAWDQVLEELARADSSFAEAERALDAALDLSRNHTPARGQLIELTYERLLLAERFHRSDERARLLRRFMTLAAQSPEWLARLDTPAELELVTEPPGATVEFFRYEAAGGQRRVRVSAGPPGTTPTARMSLPAGSYLLRVSREGHAPVQLPLLLARGQRERVELRLPAASDVPASYVYIPPGCFLSGSADMEEAREFLHSAPMHQRCLSQGFLIGQYEVTLGDWMTYLDTLPESAPQRLLLAAQPRGVGNALKLVKHPDGAWHFSWLLESGRLLSAREGEAVRYPGRTWRVEQDWRRFPLAGLSAQDLAPYLAWLDSSGRVPGARLCNELEWTRAARGADDRRFPHGDRLEKDDANIDMTYDLDLDARGPDEVGSYPASASPFGLFDMAGNAFELTTPTMQEIGDIILRGGAWYYGTVGPLVANRQAFKSFYRDARVGLRVCASLPARK